MKKNTSELLVIEKIKAYEYNENLEINNVEITGTFAIEERAFRKCKNLKNVIFNGGLTIINSGAFSGCENIEEIILPNTVKKIGSRAFADCKRLKRIVIPEGCEEIDFATFAGCENLEEIVLPQSLKNLSPQLFLNCKKLKRVVLPESTTSLPDEFFKGCHNLDTILDSKITKLGKKVFEDCYKLKNYPTQIIEAGEEAFRNCRSLEKVILNEKMQTLAKGMFEGCINLKDISTLGDEELECGERCFRNCKVLSEIPYFVKKYTRRMFENCTGLENITITDSVVPMACFRGCSNVRTINNQEKIRKIEAFAFSNCQSLQEFTIYGAIDGSIGAEAFSHCKNLKKVISKCPIRRIEARAFYNCPTLDNLDFIDTCEYIAKEAFRYCDGIKELVIPIVLKSFGDFAFANMGSLERIEVIEGNKTFMTPDSKILIHDDYQKLVLYAAGLKDKSYSLKDYILEIEQLGREIVRPITGIDFGAFAGARNLEELTICAGTSNISYTAFTDCDKLKKLNICAISFESSIFINIRDRVHYYVEKYAKYPLAFPFETIEIISDNKTNSYLYSNALSDCKNIKKIIFPKQNFSSIYEGALSNCDLAEIDVPGCVTKISPSALPNGVTVNFENGLSFNNFVSLEINDKYSKNYKLYTLSDGTYVIEQGDTITKLTTNDIRKACSKAEEIENNPVLYLDFMNGLFKNDLAIKQFFNGILIKNMSLKNREIFLKSINKEDTFALDILKNSRLLANDNYATKELLEKENFTNCLKYIELLRKYNLTDEAFCNKVLMAYYDPSYLEKLINNNYKNLERILRNGRILELDETTVIEEKPTFIKYIFEENALETFINYMDDFQLKDGFLFDKNFVSIANTPLVKKFFKNYNANLKRLVKSSEVLKNDSTAHDNLVDLFKLLKVMGCFEEDGKIKQKSSTFITEKIFAEKLPNGENNSYRIVGDDIHRVFDFTSIRADFDLEFVNFFIENYKELIEEERTKAGFIQRVYTNFRRISETTTSDRGHQRKLKVTIKKCRDFLNTMKFDEVEDDEKEFASLIGEWFDENKIWIRAKEIAKEAVFAPRNIFTEVNYDDEGKISYDYNPEHDLKEEIRPDFSYEWLPKQDYDNYILGKYCSCCAHLDGAGAGIMRASIILDNCQNLVIRNAKGRIIAKSTLYVNKNEGYAVFNNVEASLNQRSKEDCMNIYNAFLRGAGAFLETYNKNHETPIQEMLIGAKRNIILNYFDDKKHPLHKVLDCIYYGDYRKKEWNCGSYNGDCHESQRLVLKK